MVTESPLTMLSEMGIRDRDLDLFRSGSAPPSVDGSLSAIGGIFNGSVNKEGALHNNAPVPQNHHQNGCFLSDEELRSDPAYHSYYYSNVNLNPRLPPPLLSKEDWKSAQKFNAAGSSVNFGGIGDRKTINQDEEEGDSSLLSLKNGQIGFADIFQDALSYPNPTPNPIDTALSSSNGSTASHNYSSILGSPLSRSNSPDPEIVRRAPSPCLPPIGVKLNQTDKRCTITNGGPSSLNKPDKLISALSSLTISPDETIVDRSKLQRDIDTCQNNLMQHSYLKSSYLDSPRGHQVSNHLLANHVNSNSFGTLLENSSPRLLNRNGSGNLGLGPVDPLYLQYVRAAQFASRVSGNSDDPLMDLLRLQQQKQQYGYYGNLGFGSGYLGSPIASPILPSSPVSPFRHGERSIGRFQSGLRNLVGFGNLDESFVPHSLLEEFKGNKTRCYELSEIVGHVVEFSADQYGSRFIQQKLETATTEEKNMVFEEIMPHTLTLMTDVFGNYVVQKFFEHGSADQIKELADQLTGRVLALSLQMYGCRVIQKAIEVVGLEQQTKMVAELEGHVMRCVRDQNGNHVIQKCIECVPQQVIHFIVSTFFGQVVILSTHAYGCRVIQRVLEHCDDPNTQQIMMDEILESVCLLAQDQYGNYVVQHVLEHGKPEERSAIIEKLAGQIVQMSQQKFASNVVEKCLTFGTPVERQILIAEMLGPTEENEALQAMMKDQFGNYVVQKVLETCSDQQRELILTRIKIHLTALKKYTYGKHIVARVEKLVAAGERRIAIQSAYATYLKE